MFFVDFYWINTLFSFSESRKGKSRSPENKKLAEDEFVCLKDRQIFIPKLEINEYDDSAKTETSYTSEGEDKDASLISKKVLDLNNQNSNAMLK